jgi:hypothetical protein
MKEDNWTSKIKLLNDHGWVTMGATGQPCPKCHNPVGPGGNGIMHPRSARIMHAACALAVSGLRNIQEVQE